MAATTDDSNAPQATKKKYLGIPEAVFLVRKPGCLSVETHSQQQHTAEHARPPCGRVWAARRSCFELVSS